ncbi:DEAD/DEAH box helicase [Sinorhizobium fredii]|uniref:DEAD/DEAH box type DNA/RNA helicase protein n=1 Tax=Rhizobium fredii TaxID=380 RepID=A0A2L0HCP9_RHIFR|nr:DEAD/DEAH box helicase [Sinorhizobium fredii]AUX79278.1 DEAD/DEAH box type DNA/RNA helicase protein [Sinorhizobium fredii]
MFDAETAALIRSAPPLRGVDPQTLPQELTGIYAELAGLRLRAAQLAEAPDYLTQIERLARIAAVYEAQVDDTIDGETRRAAAFVAGTAYQILGRVIPVATDREAFLSAGAIHPRIAAPLLFLIAEQSPDAREAAYGLGVGRLGDIHRGALLESIQDLALERFTSILERAERLVRLQPSPDGDLTEQATQGLYGLCWAGLVQLVARLLDQPPPALAYPLRETPQALFDRVTQLAIADFTPAAASARLVSAYAGPRHLARLLRHVADGLEGAGIANLPTPAGAAEPAWRRWLRHRAVTKPTLWRNHRQAAATGFLDAGTSAVLVLPTGAGKTTLSELKIAATLSAGRKVIFLVPTLALVDQLRDDLSNSFPKSLANYQVSADGDLVALISGPELGSIEVMTPERLLAMLSFADTDVAELGLIVFDECHLLSPAGGGARSVDAMLCLLHALRRAPQADFLLLSAMLQNASDVADWLAQLSGRRCVNFLDPWKPSRQARGVAIYSKNQLDWAHGTVRAAKIAERYGQQINKPPLDLTPFALFGLHSAWARNAPQDRRIIRLSDGTVPLSYGVTGATPNSNTVGASFAASAARAGLKTIMFVNQADHAPSTARKIKAGIPAVGALTELENALWQEIIAEFGGAQHSLIDPAAPALPHNGDMISIERRLAESLFRKRDGASVIVATPTLAQGMNLPAEVAILAGTMRHDEDGREPLKGHEILNAAGRAGRAGHLANGTVLMIPEPPVSFDANWIPTGEAFAMLAKVLPANDQCVMIDDPLTTLLDRIQLGDVNSPEVRYFLSRLRAGESEEADPDRPLEMMNRSFAAFQARKAGAAAAFDVKLVSLKVALDADAQAAEASTVKIAAFSGMQLEPLTALALKIAAEIDALPTTILGWCDWLVDFLIADRASYALLFGGDVETVKAVTRGKKTGGDSTDAEIALLKPALRAWLTGAPFASIEEALGVAQPRIKTCKRSRDFVLKLMNRRFYMIAGALTALVQNALQEAGKETANPAALEVLSVAVRKGLDSPDKVAFAHRSTSIRSRVIIHRSYADRFPNRQDQIGADFQTILRSIDAHLAFGGLPHIFPPIQT